MALLDEDGVSGGYAGGAGVAAAAVAALHARGRVIRAFARPAQAVMMAAPGPVAARRPRGFPLACLTF